MKLSEWLDKKVSEGVDVSQILIPDDLSLNSDPDETIYFKEFKPCGMFCERNHPFSTVERYDHWFYSRGQDKKAGIHATGMEWRLFTKNKDLAIKTAMAHIE